ncbi:arylsulfatase [Pelagicoccus mobilis]|uniref:Arylsulfatase n=2 Tax=Pelagicoccus mobilis TaxID=415221 RepID=A0A934RWK3_9BACT|nr:arylsulfatase [Pelagicoccus mobilis]
MKPLFLGALLLIVSTAFAAERPNIVFIMADDFGLGDVSHHVREFQGKKPLVETPNVDALAKQGMWFTDGHSATALCAPTRYAVMSGNNNYRSYAPAGVWSSFGQTAFKEGEVTLGSVVQDAGYTTGFVGKWHLGGDFYIPDTKEIYRGKKNGNLTGKVDLTRMIDGGPKYCGFDYDFTAHCGIQGPMYILYENQEWYPWAKDSEIIYLDDNSIKNPKDLTSKGDGMGDSNWDARELGDILTSKAVEFIDRNANQKDPFFLYYCSPTVHIPHCPPAEFDGVKIAGSTPTDHLDMVVQLDLEVKRIVDALKANGEFENTLFVLTSDNGGLRDPEAQKLGYDPSGGWNGSKSSPLEGGHRVPFIAVWPGKISPGVSDEIAVNQDMVATFAALVGTDIPEGQAQDSLNLMPLLLGKGTFQGREYLINQAGAKQEVMLRKAPWKIIIQSNNKRTKFEPMALYNLESDPGEKKNQIKNPEFKEVAERMFSEYMSIIESKLPTVPRN